ncbi:MAG: 30S ribosomal protein S3 [Candidatus Odinarchaeia archaeon]
MPAKDHFIQRGIQNAEVDNFLAKELMKAGYGGVEIQKTPLGTRVIIKAARPGIVIGRSGRNVKELTTILEEKFGLENPQIEVDEIEVPELNARVMAYQLVQRLERGDHFRRASYSILRKVMAAGAKGVEIVISGKLTSQRARYQKFREGVISKSGEPADIYVDYASAQAMLKPGILGVSVKIMPPNVDLPDDFKVLPREEPVKSGNEEMIEEPKPEQTTEEIKAENIEPEKAVEAKTTSEETQVNEEHVETVVKEESNKENVEKTEE